MFEKLDSLETRYAELNDKLADPSVAQSPERMRELSKEHQELGNIVGVYRQYKELRQELANNRSLVAEESDAELVALAKDEIATLEQREEELRKELHVLLLPKDPNDDKNAIVEIRSGTGGDEAALFAGDLFRMYTRFAEARGWSVDLLSTSEGSKGGFKEVVGLFRGQEAYGWMKFESGVHRVQRVPETESQGRIHTSAVTVAVLPEAEEVEVDIQDKDVRIDVFRASGPGGQSVNTTDSAVRITHIPTGLVVSCQDEKSQHKNRAKAFKILASRLLDMKRAEQEAKMAETRRSMVKSGDRSEKIRTYNFPQDRVTDHRIGRSVHNMEAILQGHLDDLIEALRAEHRTELMADAGGATA